MAAKVTGISLDEKLLKKVDQLAKRRRLSRSGLVVSILEREIEREKTKDSRSVMVDGVRYVPDGDR